MSLLDFLSGTKRRLSDGAFWSNWFSSINHSQEAVNERTVMSIGAVYACNRLISETVACLPFGMHEVVDGKLAPAADHPLNGFLSISPNADQTAVEFWESVVSHIALRGGAFRLKARSLKGEVIALHYLPPPPVTYWRREDGLRICVVGAGPHKGEYPESEVFYVRGFGDHPDEGLSVISHAANDFGRILSMGRHTASFLANGVRPNMIMTTPGVLTEEQRAQVQDNIVKPFVGSKNAGGVMVLEGGFEMNQVTMKPSDAQLIEQMNAGVEDVCRWMRTPPTMIGHNSGQTQWGSGIESQLIGYGKFTIKPFTTRIIQAVQKDLMAPADRVRFRPVIDLDGLMQGDSKTRAEVSSLKVRSGILSVNEARALDNLPPVEGGYVPRMQQQMVQITQTDEV